MTLPSIVDGTQAYYETQRRASEREYARQIGLPAGESLLQRLLRRLRKSPGRVLEDIQKPATVDRVNANRPPAFSK